MAAVRAPIVVLPMIRMVDAVALAVVVMMVVVVVTAVAVAMVVVLLVVQAEVEPMAVRVVAKSAIVVEGVVIPRIDMESEMTVTAVMAERAVLAVAALPVLSVVASVTRT